MRRRRAMLQDLEPTVLRECSCCMPHAKPEQASSSTINGSPASPGARRRPSTGTISSASMSFRDNREGQGRRAGAMRPLRRKRPSNRDPFPLDAGWQAPARPARTPVYPFTRSWDARPGPTRRAVPARHQSWDPRVDGHDPDVFDLWPNDVRLSRTRPGRVGPAVAICRRPPPCDFSGACTAGRRTGLTRADDRGRQPRAAEPLLDRSIPFVQVELISVKVIDAEEPGVDRLTVRGHDRQTIAIDSGLPCYQAVLHPLRSRAEREGMPPNSFS